MKHINIVNNINTQSFKYYYFLLFISGCQFYPPGEYLRFIRVPENLKVGEEVLRVDVFPRNNLNLLPVDKVNINLVVFSTIETICTEKENLSHIPNKKSI